ncbi:MAG: long-chain fatty acid--CoA ligase [Candidatus Brocadiae bacterium]|nr:long-chain fatty acid--CoA ligase [Candidatus Brocadiia bacterium]
MTKNAVTTILHHLYSWAQEKPGDIAQSFVKNGKREYITAKEYWENVFYMALYWENICLKPEDICVIFSYNCPRWVYAELSLGMLGVGSAGLYPNLSGKDIHYIIEDTRAKILIVQNHNYYEKILAEGGLPSFVEKILVLEGDSQFSSKAISFEQTVKMGETLSQGRDPVLYLHKIDIHKRAYLIYTSGTTGNPKGAMLSQDNFLFISQCLVETMNLPQNGSTFSFLPLCHIAEKLQNLGLGLCCRNTVHFCYEFKEAAKELQEVQPTLFLGVPRVWEKMVEAVSQKIEEAPKIRRFLAKWAMRMGAKEAEYIYSQKPMPWYFSLLLKVADKVVLYKIRKALGLGNASLCVSGAASLPVHVNQWLRGLRIRIYEAFGQTESSGVICVTPHGIDCLGTVGKPLSQVEFKLSDEGEILSKGRHIFLGYHNQPASTQSTLQDGWLYTGDLGSIDSHGLLKIIGRKKEIIKTSGGKMIAPVPLEEKIKLSPLVSQTCLVGEGRKYLVALVTLKENIIQKLLSENRLDHNFLVQDKEIAQKIQEIISQANESLSSYEKIKYFTILRNDFQIQTGELTPTMKLKRKEVEHRYKKIIDQMYLEEPNRKLLDEPCPLLCSTQNCICNKNFAKVAKAI